MVELSIAVAFLAGVVSFLSPCILPLIPGYLAYLAGSSLEEKKINRLDVFLASVFFVLGFALVFSIVGVLLNTALERIAFDVQQWLSRVAGVVIFAFGLYLLGAFKIGFLEKQRRISAPKFKSRWLTSFVFGAAFAVGWTPCVGVVLGSIFALATVQAGTAFTLLLAYSLGLGIPFLLVGAFASQASGFIQRHSAALNYLIKVFGLALIILGILVFTQKLNQFANFEAVAGLLK